MLVVLLCVTQPVLPSLSAAVCSLGCWSSLWPHCTFLSTCLSRLLMLHMVHMCELTTHHLSVAITNVTLLFQVLLTLTSQHVSGNIFTVCESVKCCVFYINHIFQSTEYVYVSFSCAHMVVYVKALCLWLHKQPHLEKYWNTVYKPSDVVGSPYIKLF